MNQGGYVVEVTGLSPETTEKDVFDFFTFSGVIENVEVVRYGESASTAYVTFKDSYSQGTACLLSFGWFQPVEDWLWCYEGTRGYPIARNGATILDQRVCITRWGNNEDELDFWNRSRSSVEDETESNSPQGGQFVQNAGEAAAMAQEVVKTMLSKGFVLGKDALSKAKAFDESHQVSATAAAKVAELSERIGLADTIFAGMEAVRAIDEKYHVSETTKSAVSATGRTATAAANNVVNSSYFSRGALWLSGALDHASKAAADLGNRGAQ